jgi:hypothetical protein
MRLNAGRFGGWLFVMGMLFTAIGCATAPPARQVTSLQQIAGKWEGTVTVGTGMAFIKNMVIRPDGTWELEIPGGNPPRHDGTVQLVDGKLRSRSNTTGNTGTWTLHEGDGKRMLKTVSDDGRTSAELTPVK